MLLIINYDSYGNDNNHNATMKKRSENNNKGIIKDIYLDNDCDDNESDNSGDNKNYSNWCNNKTMIVTVIPGKVDDDKDGISNDKNNSIISTTCIIKIM